MKTASSLEPVFQGAARHCRRAKSTPLATLMALFAAAALVQPLRTGTFESGETQAAPLELFTSEDCGSCPPAEACLATLRDDHGLWKKLVPVAFHVDCWDGPGGMDHLTRRGGQWTASLTLPPKTRVPVAALAVRVRAAGDPTTLQAMGGWLKK